MLLPAISLNLSLSLLEQIIYNGSVIWRPLTLDADRGEDMERIKIEDIPGFSFGQAEDRLAGTGASMILCQSGAVCGVDVRGGSPGTRDTDALNPVCNREVVHSVLLTGGSAFGLDAAGGVMKVLEQHRIGRDVGVTVVPNVCAAVLFDLKCGRSDIRPDEAMGREAALSALRADGIQTGCHGAGTGATIGKLNGLKGAMKGGIGSYALRAGQLMVGAVVAVNCIGDVCEQGKIIAGSRTADGHSFADSERLLLERYETQTDIFSSLPVGGNTVIGCVVTNASLTKAQVNKLAAVSHNGLARAIRPAHTTYDGDTLFAMSCGAVSADPDAVGVLAARAVEGAILEAVRNAESLLGYVAMRDLPMI